jgi:hypothetical protein
LVKERCLRAYEEKCQKSVQNEVYSIEKKIKQDLYQNTDDFKEDVEKMKKTFEIKNFESQYVHKDLVLLKIVEKILLRGFEQVLRLSADLSKNQNRTLSDKVQIMDREAQTKKSD